MSINLLPSEEKAKIKKDNQAAVPIMEMTGFTEPDKKHKSAVQGGGVLSFFKAAFTRPKKAITEEENRKAEQKIILQEKIIIERPKEKVTPQLHYAKPILPPAAKPMQMPGANKPGLFARMFSSKKNPTIQIEKKIILPPKPGEDKFPAYHPVKAEKIIPAASPVKPNHPEVIQVTTIEKKQIPVTPIKDEPSRQTKPQVSIFNKINKTPQTPQKYVLDEIKKQEKKEVSKKPAGPSIWLRLSSWFKNVFSRKAPPKKEPLVMPPAPKPANIISAPPKPVFGQTPVVEKRPAPIISPARPGQTAQNIPMDKKPMMPSPVAPSANKPSSIFGFKLPHKNAEPKIDEQKKSSIPSLPDSPMSKIKTSDSIFTQPAEGFSKPFGIDWEVNLVPEEAIEHEVPLTKILVLAAVVVISCALVFGGWLAADWQYNNKTKQIGELNNQIAQAETTIRGFKALQDNVKSLNDLFTSVRTMLDKHIYWSQLFSKLERYTLPDVYYSGMAADVNGAISLTASARDYETAIKQLYVYQQAADFVSKADISGITFVNNSTTTRSPSGQTTTVTSQSQQVNFSISLTGLPGIFYQTQ